MNVLPRGPVAALDWAYNAWGQTHGPAVTVPADALQVLIDQYLVAMRALEENVKGVLSERAESVPVVDMPVGG